MRKGFILLLFPKSVKRRKCDLGVQKGIGLLACISLMAGDAVI